jgi:hypothetical protein
VFAGGHATHRRPSQRVEQLNSGVADHQAARRAGRDRDFERQCGRGSIGQCDGSELLHGLLKRQGAGNRA